MTKQKRKAEPAVSIDEALKVEDNTVTEKVSKQYSVKVIVNGLNCRERPDINSDVVRQFDIDQILTILEEAVGEKNTVWGKVGNEKWVNLRFCSKV
jgi:hypothetical protein